MKKDVGLPRAEKKRVETREGFDNAAHSARRVCPLSPP